MMILIAFIAFVVASIEIEYLYISKENPLTNSPILHSILGLVISLLLAFRTKEITKFGGKGENHGARWRIAAATLPLNFTQC